mmetsp:Transcript_90473/g.255811  ORF Transcript_90473/g.255811 Transcript_90473/m.255811 type:complete len:264 (-) Transcript_90473:198-989(-)
MAAQVDHVAQRVPSHAPRLATLDHMEIVTVPRRVEDRGLPGLDDVADRRVHLGGPGEAGGRNRKRVHQGGQVGTSRPSIVDGLHLETHLSPCYCHDGVSQPNEPGQANVALRADVNQLLDRLVLQHVTRVRDWIADLPGQVARAGEVVPPAQLESHDVGGVIATVQGVAIVRHIAPLGSGQRVSRKAVGRVEVIIGRARRQQVNVDAGVVLEVLEEVVADLVRQACNGLGGSIGSGGTVLRGKVQLVGAAAGGQVVVVDPRKF